MESLGIRLSLEFSTPQKRYIGFRCLHMAEGGYPNPEGMPVVRPSVNAPPIVFTRDMQLLSYNINNNNPYLTKDKWRVVYNNGKAFTNDNGFDKDGDPRRDYVNLRDLEEPYPKLMKAVICGGMFIRGDVIGNNLVCLPGVHAIDANKSMPNIQTILEKNWYFIATTGGRDRISNFPQGGGLPVIIPFFLKEPTPYPMIDDEGYRWFTEWNETYLPNPLTIYNPV